MISSDSDSSLADVDMLEMNENEQPIRQLCPTLHFRQADNERPFTPMDLESTRRNFLTMPMVDSRGNESDRGSKQKHETDEKCYKRVKQLRPRLPDPAQVGRNSDVNVDINSTGSGSGGDRLLHENTGSVIQKPLFDPNEMYQTTTATRNALHGTAYQWKHMMLIVHRAREKGYLFRIATEMDAAEKFDDAVLEYQDPLRGRVLRFLQFKHTSGDKKMIKVGDLLTTAKQDPFGMVKYFNSWRKIRNNPIFNASSTKEFFLCTNWGLDVVGLEAKNIKVKETAMDDLLRVTDGPKQAPLFYKFVDETSSLCNKLAQVDGASQEDVSEFLEEFILAVNQPNETELGDMIKRELGASDQFNLLNVDDIVNSFENMMVNLLKETGGRTKFLTHEKANAFFEELQGRLSSFITVGLKLSYSAKLKNYDIKFEEENSDVRNYLDCSNSEPNSALELRSSNPTLLTALRVYQTLEQLEMYKKRDSLISIHLEDLLLPDIPDQVLFAFRSSISHDLLVIVCESISNNEATRTLLNQLDDILTENPRKKLILIIRENDTSALRRDRHKRDDEISIIDLEKYSRQKLLKKSSIKFQGHDKRISFGRIFGIHDFDDIGSNKLSALKKIISREILVQLIRDEEILIGDEMPGLGEVAEYYIPRTIIEHVLIKATILKESKIPDLFAISGIDHGALKKLVRAEIENQSLDRCRPTEIDPKKYHILENGRETEHFKNICERNPERNVHWLQGESGELLWQQSFGSITNLIAFRNTCINYGNNERSGAIYLTENELAHNDEKRRIVILSDTAGMGKSTLLTYLAGKMKRDRSSLLVIKVDLSQHTRVLNEERQIRTFKRNDTNGAVDFLVNKLLNLSTDLEREIFEEIVKVTGETALLFDGYDEICPTYGQIVIDLLQTFAKLRIKRLIVTTRPHKSDALERELGTFSYVLQPFSPANQMEFLTKFWGREINSNNPDETIGESSEEHASAVLKILDKLINPRMHQFTGIPLQTRLVAEAFPYEEKEELNLFDSSTEPRYITDLYKRFVVKKFKIYFEDKLSNDPMKPGQKRNIKVIYRTFLIKHQELALEALFDEETVMALIKCQQKIDEMFFLSQEQDDEYEGEEQSGIVTQVIDGKPHFIHQTFAEYFAAEFLFEKLQDNGCDQQVQKFFVAELLVGSRYETIRAFLNSLLSGRSDAPDKESWTMNLRENSDVNSRTLYYVAAVERNIEIIRFFSNRLGTNRKNETSHNVTKSGNVTESAISLVEKSPKQYPDINLTGFDGRTPLVIAILTGVLALVICCVEAGADVNSESNDGFTPLHRAVGRGAKLDVVRYLVEKGAEINRQSNDGYTPLQSALRGGAELDVIRYLVEKSSEINRESKDGYTPLQSALWGGAKLDVVRYLVEKGAEIIHESKDGYTPLQSALWGGAKLDVVRYLVEKGAEINRQSNDGYTPLQSALWGRTKLDVVRYLVEKGAEINRQSNDGYTPLQSALRGGAELDVIRYLVEKGAEINRQSNDGYTPLQSALRGGAELDVIRYLVEKSSEINRESKDGYTPLQSALWGGAKLDVVRYLVEKGAEINRQSNDGYTPLQSALWGRTKLDVVRYLVEKGAEINRQSNDGYTPLQSALRGGAELDVIRYLVEKSSEINRESKDGYTPLQSALWGGAKLDVVRYLVEKGAEIIHESKDGYTPLQSALWGGAKLDVVRYLVEKGAEINRQSNDGYTPLQSALWGRTKLDVVRYLVEKGAEINRQSNDGYTPLQSALRGGAELDVIRYLVEKGAEINRQSNDGYTPLQSALRGGAELDVIRYLVEKSSEINRESKDGYTPLQSALWGGAKLDVVRYLVEKGAEINRQSNDGYTPLQSALWGRTKLDVVRYLVEKGAEINRQSNDGYTPLQSALRGGAELDVIRYLVEKGAEINRQSNDGYTPLQSALRGGAELDVIRYLVEKSSEINRESKDGYTPLQSALWGGAKLDVVRYLVEKGAEINRQSNDGYTPLQSALWGRTKLDVVRYLVEKGAEINCKSKDGSTLLHSALGRGAQLDVVRYLVEKGAEINRQSNDGYTPLQSALRGGAELDVIRYLVEKSSEINRESKDGYTPLQSALWGGAKLDVVRYLVEKGAEINRQSNDGYTPLQSALWGRTKLDVVRYLVEKGAEIIHESKDGYTPLQSALRGGAELDVVRYLVEKGSEINRESKDGYTPLQSALWGGAKLDVVRYLVEKGAEIIHESKDGFTPLQSALWGGAKLDVVRYLVEKGAEINCNSKDGYTPLHSALGGGAELDVVRYLVEEGAEINRESRDGWTPLRLALRSGDHTDVVEYLIGKGAIIHPVVR